MALTDFVVEKYSVHINYTDQHLIVREGWQETEAFLTKNQGIDI